MKKKKLNEGFTLVELMVTVVASSILILIISLILVMAFQSWRINTVYVALRRDSAFAFHMMAKDVRETPYADITDGSTLILPSAILGNPTVTYQILTITNASDVLTYNNGTGPMRIIPKNVQEFRALKTNDGVLLTLELVDSEFDITLTNQVFVNTRN